jgi:cystathionine beta-lyase family protein involved in aluminum resistance
VTEFLIRATVQMNEPTPDMIKAIRIRVRNLLMDFGQDVNVIVDFSPIEAHAQDPDHLHPKEQDQ